MKKSFAIKHIASLGRSSAAVLLALALSLGMFGTAFAENPVEADGSDNALTELNEPGEGDGGNGGESGDPEPGDGDGEGGNQGDDPAPELLPIGKATVTLSKKSYVYDRAAHTPKVTVTYTLDGKKVTLVRNVDYKQTYATNRTSAKTHTIVITGMGNYEGTLTATYKITRKSLSKFSAKLKTTFYKPNGTKRTPSATVKGKVGGKTVKLKKGRDFKITYKNNVKAGVATATISGIGNYKGSKKLQFVIASDKAAPGMYKKIANLSSRTKYIIAVSCKNHRVAIYKGKKGAWKQIQFWKCTNGAPSTPSRKGTFTVGSRGTAFGSGYTCWYWTQWSGNYLFHSVLYNPGSKTSVQDGRLGIAASHGCIRLAIGNAKWIYNNIPRGTKVVVY